MDNDKIVNITTRNCSDVQNNEKMSDVNNNNLSSNVCQSVINTNSELEKINSLKHYVEITDSE